MLPGPAAFRTSLAWVTSGPNKPPRLWTRKTRFYGTSIPQSHSGPILTFWNRTGWLTQGLYWAQSSSLHTILYWTAHRSIPPQSGVQNNSPSLAPGGTYLALHSGGIPHRPSRGPFPVNPRIIPIKVAVWHNMTLIHDLQHATLLLEPCYS